MGRLRRSIERGRGGLGRRERGTVSWGGRGGVRGRGIEDDKGD
jgi:hypothetical protein